MEDINETKEEIKDDEIVFALAMKYDNDLRKVYDAISNNEYMKVDELINYINSAVEKYVTHNSSLYPMQLRSIQSPPVVIFYEGKLDVCKDADLIMFNGLFGTNKRGYLFVVEDENGECDWLIACEKQEHLSDFIEIIHKQYKLFNLKEYKKDDDFVLS